MTVNRDFKADFENKLYTNTDSISSLIPFRFHGINYLIDLKAEPLLRAYFISAIKAYTNREKDLKFDDLIKNVDLKDFSDDKFGIVFERIRQSVVDEAYAVSQIIRNYSLWESDDSKKSNQFYTTFVACMHRLQVSFTVAASLLNFSFFVEVIPVYRLILEQLALGAFLLIETDAEMIENNQVPKNIEHLKTILNKKSIGNLYGYLSSGTHLAPKVMGKYAFINEEERTAYVKNRSGKECIKETGNLIFLLKIYGEIVWKGINYFGFTALDKKYFQEWYDLHKDTIDSIYKEYNKALKTGYYK